MKQRALGIVGGALLVVGVALAVVSGIVAHSSASWNAMPPTNAAAGNERSEPVRPPIQRREGPGPFVGGPGGRDLPGGSAVPNGPDK